MDDVHEASTNAARTSGPSKWDVKGVVTVFSRSQDMHFNQTK